ncbi:S-layer homology domain-containing protein [Paenibacillus pini]|uniref:SLH domain-containing protein n=1 Tax=Paenibacillus pini JCM 16418 TaxID=1236976 RepID=W7YV21_9BACL|nr:S-layer homology domain-containing protein [Paenibacillus pini]GAF08441.1 hypothetical protein JCM16418_2515 [Paenibacillus pini JCM 16418]
MTLLFKKAARPVLSLIMAVGLMGSGVPAFAEGDLPTVPPSSNETTNPTVTPPVDNEAGNNQATVPTEGEAGEAPVTIPTEPMGGAKDVAMNEPVALAASSPITKVTVTFNGDTKTAKGFTWYTSLESEKSDVQVVEQKGSPDFTNAQRFEGRSSVAKNSNKERLHKAEATGLAPDTSYYFRVGDADLNIWSEVGTFRTAPVSGAFTFIDLTDTQAKEEDEADLSAQTIKKAMATIPNANFILHSGDIVDTGTKEEQWNWLLGHSQDSLMNITLAPAAGNHEDKNYGYYEHFNVSEAVYSPTEKGAYYSYDYSNAHFIIMNSNENSEEYANFTPAQVSWLKADVEAARKAGAKWIIVNFHKGPYTTSNHATDTDIMGANGVRNKIAPIMAELAIDFVVQGHDHIYARSKPINKEGKATTAETITETLNGKEIKYTVNPDGAIYMIPATAGPKVYYKNTKIDPTYYDLFDVADENHAAKYGPDPSDSSRPKRSQVQNFVGITIDGDKLTAVSYEIDQNVDGAKPYIIDQFGIVKQTAPKPVPISKVTVTFNGDTKTAKGFTWYTPLASSGNDLQVIEKTSSKADFNQATHFSGRSSISTNSKEERLHKAEATGLKPDTSYYFRVGDEALNSWSEVGTFRTAPVSGAFTFIDLTDTQAKEEDEADLSAQTIEKAMATIPNANFILHSGDIVDTGTKEEQWNWLLGHSQQSLLNITMAPAAGNHEDKKYGYYEHFNVKEATNSATETGAYYSYDYSNAHFIIMNSNENSEEYANFTPAQVAWLKADVEAARKAGAKWIIVNFHKGPYTTSNHATDTDIMGANGVRNKIAPIMAQLGIDFVVQGHDHIYARSKPINKEGKATVAETITETLNGKEIKYTVNPDGAIYMIPATAGAKVYYKNTKIDPTYYDLFNVADENHAAKYGADPSDSSRPKRGQVQNFVGITIDGDKLTAVSYEIDQNVNDAKPYIIDQFGIKKQSKDGGTVTNPGSGSGTGSGSGSGSGSSSGSGSNSNSKPSGTTGSNTNGTTTGTTGGSTSSGSTGTNGTGTTIPTNPTAPQPTKVNFSDIAKHWAADVITQAASRGFISGYADGTFRPDQKVNRVEFTTMLAKALNLTGTGKSLSFKDNNNIPAWAKTYVAQAVQAGIVSGYADQQFRPSQEISRAEMAALISKAMGIQVNHAAKLPFADASKAPKWAVPYIAAVTEAGLVNGVGGNRFAPNQSATRAEAATWIMALLQHK